MQDPTKPLPTIDPTQPLSVSEIEKQANNKQSSMVRETSWKPGQSGNPHGRPKKGYSIAEVWRSMFAADSEKKHQLADKIFQAAVNGDTQAQKLIVQYMDGMPAQAIDLTSGGEQLKTPQHFIPTEKDE